jgi:hypothetical protein
MPDPDADRPLVLAALAGGVTLCADCIARKAGVSSFRVEDAAQRLSGNAAVKSEVGRCQSCRVRALVHRLA